MRKQEEKKAQERKRQASKEKRSASAKAAAARKKAPNVSNQAPSGPALEPRTAPTSGININGRHYPEQGNPVFEEQA